MAQTKYCVKTGESWGELCVRCFWNKFGCVVALFSCGLFLECRRPLPPGGCGRGPSPGRAAVESRVCRLGELGPSGAAGESEA